MNRKIVFAVVMALMVSVFAIAVSAEVSVKYTLEQTTDSNTGSVSIYQIVATLTDTETDFRAYEQNITFDNNVIIPVSAKSGKSAPISTSPTVKTPLDTYSYSYYDEINEEDATITASYPSDGILWNANGAESTLETKVYVDANNYPANGVTVFELHFVLADGYTVDDFDADTFKVDYIKYTSNEYHYYGNEDASLNDITIDTSSFIPEPTVITVPVTAGDIVYLQDGTFATAEVAGDYEVLNDVGYVAVNTDNEDVDAQKTYYIDGTTATEVHSNGIVSTNKYGLRGPDETYNGEDRSGLRFKMEHATAGRTAEGHEIVEVGVLMTVESDKVKNNFTGDIDNLVFSDVGTYVKSGYALGQGYDRVFDRTDDENWVISAVMYNITLNETNVTTNIVCRPFYKVGEAYIYGETMKATLYNIAKSIKNDSEKYEACSDEMRGYIDEIVGLVDPTIVEEEIIIDVGELYKALAALEGEE